MNDDLEHLLGPPPSSSSQLRDWLGEETARRVRRRRWARWGRTAAMLLLCYAAGAATIALVHPEPEPRIQVIEKVIEVPAPQPELPPSPRALELAAEQASDAEAARLYFDAGRLYGRDWNDWASAMRCYRNALDLLGEVPAPDPMDDWLLAKLKTARKETYADANP